MQYLGGKARLAAKLCDAIRPEGYRFIWEPFCGGFNMTAELCRRAPNATILAADIDSELIALGRALQAGWEPPAIGRNLTDLEYAAFREAEQSPIRTFVSFACSWGGKKWGGLARSGRQTYYEEGRRALLCKRDAFSSGLRFQVLDFVQTALSVSTSLAGVLVYLDPPYYGTTAYEAAEIDRPGFVLSCRCLRSLGATVYLSEFSASDDFEPVLTISRKTTVVRADHAVRQDTLFRMK